MPPRSATKTSALSVLLLIASACATGSSQAGAPVHVDEMNTCVERVHVEADRSRMALGEAFERLNALAGGRFGKESAVTSYARFVQAIDVAEQQARRFREVVGPMQDAAKVVLEQWQTEVITIGNERLRQRSELRLAVAKERYDAITKAAVPAQDQFDSFVKSLRDHATFLAHDLNATAIDDIQDEVKEVARVARDLDQSFEATLRAARAYVENSSLPVAPPSAPPPAR